MNQRVITWVLFAAWVCTVPVLYFMFVIGGLLPLVAIIRLCFSGVLGFKLFTAVHLLIYGPIFYLLARLLTRWLFSFAPEIRALGVAAVLALALATSFLPIYGIGHSAYTPVNLYRLFQNGWLE